MEKNELKVALEFANKSLSQNSNGVHEVSVSFPGKEELESTLQKLEKDPKETSNEKDTTLQQLNRLKQHLLEKESEDSEKMDEDSKMIEGLREDNEKLKAQIRYLNQAIAGHEEAKTINTKELFKSREIIGDLNKKIHAKNSELLSLQTALGQCYAEVDTKDHLERELASVRQESAKHSELLKEAYEQAETTKQEKMEIMEKLRGAERVVTEVKGRVNKVEENNSKLRRALEQSMTRLNRMSMDSDFSVDRRIVIKLLVTYFQSKEVMELMVRMLGFSEVEKQRIGVAQQGVAGKGVVRQVGLDVHDDDGDNDGDDYESEISNSRNSSFFDRRTSLNHGRSFSPMANGHDSTSNSEIAQYKSEIKRLQDSEAQIQALSVNYAALLKQKEVGLHAEHGYIRSLAQFGSNLGPIVWKVASKKNPKSLATWRPIRTRTFSTYIILPIHKLQLHP